MSRTIIPFAVLVALQGVACSGSSEPDAPYQTRADGLELASPLTFDDLGSWSTPWGPASLSSSTTRTQGAASLEVSIPYYTVIESTRLGALSSVGDNLTLDVRTSLVHGWGEVVALLASEAQPWQWQEIGRVSIVGLAANSFHQLEFALSPAIRSLLTTRSDLKLVLTLNGAPSTFWLDNGSFGGESSAEPCSDGVLGDGEVTADCGGVCGQCGPSALGILWSDKFTDGVQSGWSANGFAVQELQTLKDYADLGSGSPVVGADGSASITSPVVDLSGATGTPLLRFQRLIGEGAGAVNLEVNVGSGWQQLRDLTEANAADGRWRTEYFPLQAFVGTSHFQFRVNTSGGASVQLDDFAIEDRGAVDGTHVVHDFLMRPGSLGNGQAWEWKVDESGAWNSATPGPFNDDSWPVVDETDLPHDIWLRTKLTIAAAEDLAALRFFAVWDDQIDIRVDGTSVFSADSWTQSFQYIETQNALHAGENIIEVHARDVGGGRLVDVGITREPLIVDFPEAVYPAELGAGSTHPLASFAKIEREFIASRDLPGVAFALYKDGSPVLDMAHGFHDKARTTPMPLNPTMRLASVDKSFVIAAAAKLISDGFRLVDDTVLSRETYVFPMLRELYGLPSTADQAGSWAEAIQMKHLMDHTSHINGLPEGGSADYYDKVGSVQGHTTKHDHAVFMHREGCWGEPGTEGDGYNNAGYMLLRYVIDQITPDGFLKYTRDNIQSDVYLAHESLLGRHPTEPWYATGVPPYDRWMNLENYLGLAATPRAVAELGVGYHLIDGHAAPYGGLSEGCEIRGGGMTGTTAFGVQCDNGITFGLLMSGNAPAGSYDDLMGALLNNALSLSDSDWTL